MSVPAIGPLTMAVVIHDDTSDPPVRGVLISAFCSTCGERRGPAHRELECSAAGVPCWVDRWENACGHADTDNAIAAEVACECAALGCVLLADGRDYPYCSVDCAAAARGPASCHARNAALLAQLRAQREIMRGLRTEMAARLEAVRRQVDRSAQLVAR